MRARSMGAGWLLTVAIALVLVPATVYAQSDDVTPDAVFPFPIYHDRPEQGGFYTYGQFVMFQQTNPMGHQPIAYRGFTDSDGTITGTVGQYIGSGRLAASANDVGGPGTFQPGFQVGAGWRFSDGSSVSVDWMYLTQASYNYAITGVPPDSLNGANLADTFLSSPVFNFPSAYAGAAQKTTLGLPYAVYGIWNGAEEMSMSFTQRTQQIQATFRKPIFETENYRCYGLAGPRFFWIWENFEWRTVDQDIYGDQSPTTTAIYNNITSNRMYGAFIGLGNEWYLGHRFALSWDVQAAALLDVVKERASYELGLSTLAPQNKRQITQFSPVPEISTSLNLLWYPIEGVELRLGWNLMGFFNTIASPNPVSFDYGSLDPAWVKQSRLFNGLNAGIGIIF